MWRNTVVENGCPKLCTSNEVSTLVVWHFWIGGIRWFLKLHFNKYNNWSLCSLIIRHLQMWFQLVLFKIVTGLIISNPPNYVTLYSNFVRFILFAMVCCRVLHYFLGVNNTAVLSGFVYQCFPITKIFLCYLVVCLLAYKAWGFPSLQKLDRHRFIVF